MNEVFEFASLFFDHNGARLTNYNTQESELYQTGNLEQSLALLSGMGWRIIEFSRLGETQMSSGEVTPNYLAYLQRKVSG